jgi:6-phosphogluconolactonase
MERNFDTSFMLVKAEDNADENFIKIVYKINCIILECQKRKGSCHIMLTGGRSAKLLYQAWAANLGKQPNFNGVHFYFGDERAVSPEHPESNYRLVLDTLFIAGIPAGAQIHRMDGSSGDLDGAAREYDALLPGAIDLLLLSMGDDGHIASLFPYSVALNENKRRVVQVVGHKLPSIRLTITPMVIRSAHNVFVMALGEKKRFLYNEALHDPDNIDPLPARIAIRGLWFFGELE